MTQTWSYQSPEARVEFLQAELERLRLRFPYPICWATHRGMLCDRIADHHGWHVDIFGPELSDHTWPSDQPNVAVEPYRRSEERRVGKECR